MDSKKVFQGRCEVIKTDKFKIVKEIKSWRIPVADGQVIVVSRANLKRGGKVVCGRIRRGRLDELLQLQKMVDLAVEEALKKLAKQGEKLAS